MKDVKPEGVNKPGLKRENIRSGGCVESEVLMAQALSECRCGCRSWRDLTACFIENSMLQVSLQVEERGLCSVRDGICSGDKSTTYRVEW